MKKRWNSEYKYYFLISLLGLVVIVSMISFTYAYSNGNKLVAEVSSLSEEEAIYKFLDNVADSEKAVVTEEYADKLYDVLTLIEDVIDMAHSPAAQNDTTHFWYDDTKFKIEKGDEPKMSGGYKLANSVADALVLQCYESESMTAFGHELTEEQWRAVWLRQ